MSILQASAMNNPALETAQVDAVDAARINAYRVLARLVSVRPTREFLEALRQIDAVEMFENQSEPLSASWRMLKLAAERTTLETVDEEYHVLFIGLARGELVPYASWYLTGFLMDQPLVILRRDLSALGYARQDGVGESEDHVGALCETMSLLIDSVADTGIDAQRDFFKQHLAPWIGKFFSDLQNAPSASFYRAVGEFGQHFIRQEKRILAL